MIELLVVISIIGLLSSVVMVNLSKAKAKARDARRIQDLRQIDLVIKLYYDAKGYYPACSTVYITSAQNDCLTNAIKAQGLASELPYDPLTQGGNGSWGRDYQYAGGAQIYYLRGGLETDSVVQSHIYPLAVPQLCPTPSFPNCEWYKTCVYRGYNLISCGLSIQYGSK